MQQNKQQIALRVDPSTIDKITRILDAYTQGPNLPDLAPTRTAVMRAALERGLDAMLAELAVKSGRKRKR